MTAAVPARYAAAHAEWQARHDAYLAELEAAVDHARARSLAIALHEAFDTWAGSGHELNCYDCATWPDPNTPGWDPKPEHDCWQLAAEMLRNGAS